MQKLTILSDSGVFKCEVAATRDGARAVYYRNLKGWRRLSHETFDLPFHAALDVAHDALQRLIPFRSREI